MKVDGFDLLAEGAVFAEEALAEAEEVLDGLLGGGDGIHGSDGG